MKLDKIIVRLSDAKKFGFRKLANGTMLLGHVPHVAPEAYFHVVFAPLTEADVATFECEALRRQIPELYRSFLLQANGLTVFSNTLELYGFRRSYVRKGDESWQPFALETPNLSERPRDSTQSQFFIGGYDDGSRMYLEEGRVIRCARTSSKPLNTWPSFEEMLISEIERLSVLFDASGRLLCEWERLIPSSRPRE